MTDEYVAPLECQSAKFVSLNLITGRRAALREPSCWAFVIGSGLSGKSGAIWHESLKLTFDGMKIMNFSNKISQFLPMAALFLVASIAHSLSQETPEAKTNASDLGNRRSSCVSEPLHPAKVSSNGRYFVDRNGQPIFWLGTTQWELFRGYKLEETEIIIERTKANGFAFAQVMLLGVGDGTVENVYGEKPWIDDNPLTPNEAYFKHVDAVVDIARKHNLAISMTLFHQRYRNYITEKNAREWAKWIARRYKDVPTLIWSTTPEASAEFVPILRELAAGLIEEDGGTHLITFKPDPAPYSSSFLHAENWLDFNSIQTWNRVDLIYPMVTKDYQLRPAKPVLMAEGAYEAGTEYGFDVTPLWTRRQAYYAFLAGAHYTYGHNDSWRVLPTWKQALDAPGASQMCILKNILMAQKEWWYLIPDQSVLAAGGRTDGKVLNLAVRHKDGKWIIVYLGGADTAVQQALSYFGDTPSITIRMNKITASDKVDAFWVDPRSGQFVKVGSFSNEGEPTFSVPHGWEDAILILKAVTN